MKTTVVLAVCVAGSLAVAEAPGSYAGVGMMFGKTEDSAFTVDFAYGGSSAEEAGILPGDRLEMVAGRPLKGLTAEQVAALIRGEPGTGVDITVLRSGESVKMTVLRRNVVFPESLYPVRTGQGYGYIDRQTGRMFLPPVFTKAGRFSEGLANVCRRRLEGYIDRTGRAVSGLHPGYVSPFVDGVGVLTIALRKRCWLFGRDGRARNDTGIGMHVLSFSEGLGLVTEWDSEPRKYGFIDTAGRLVLDTVYRTASRFSEGLAVARGEDGYGHIDRAGNWAIEPNFIHAGSFFSGRARVKYDGGIGYIDRTGRLAIELRDVQAAEEFSDGLAVFRRGRKFGCIDTAGRVVIEPQFEAMGPFHCGRAWAQVGSECGYVDRTGRMVIPAQFARDDIGNFADGLVVVKHLSKYQCMDVDGKVIWREV